MKPPPSLINFAPPSRGSTAIGELTSKACEESFENDSPRGSSALCSGPTPPFFMVWLRSQCAARWENAKKSAPGVSIPARSMSAR